MENEIWKPIVGSDGSYEVSSLGRVRSLVGKKKSVSPHIMSLSHDSQGYQRVGITVNKKRETRKVHRLVAEAFIPNPENKPCIDHMDGNPSNNTISNLRWCTRMENSNNPISIERHSSAAKRSVPKAWQDGHYKKMTRRVAQLSNDDEIIRVWDSVSMASRGLGLRLGNLFACIWGHRKTCGGFKWMYLEPGKRKNANNSMLDNLEVIRRYEMIRNELVK